MPGKRSSFGSPVEPISPPPEPAPESGLGWRRRVPPPGPKDLFRRPFIAIAARAGGSRNIGRDGRGGKRRKPATAGPLTSRYLCIPNWGIGFPVAALYALCAFVPLCLRGSDSHHEDTK